MGKKTNKTFMLLSVLGIVYVVDVHAGSPLAILTNLFPYDSFFMPLFVFISGYFFNQEKSLFYSYVYHKFKNLVIPYYKYNICISLLWLLICLPFPILHGTNSNFSISNTNWYVIVQNIFYIPITYGTPFDLISPSWFLISLFFTVFFYLIIKKLTYNRLNEWQLLILLFLLGIGCIYLARKGFSVEPCLLPILKVGFFIPIFHIGYMMKILKFDPHYMKTLGFGIVINFLILFFYTNKDISFESLAFMLNFKTDNLLLPYITSLSGIAFYYGVCKLMVPVLGDNKVLNLISENTLSILCLHLLFFNILNYLYFIVTTLGFLPDFNTDAFQHSAWYIFAPSYSFKLLYLFIGIIGPLLVVLFWRNFIKLLMNIQILHTVCTYISIKKN